MNTRKILEALQRGEIKLSEAEAQLKGFEDLGHSRVDLEREERNGTPEVIYGGGKTPEQIIDIMVSMEARGQNILATRIAPEVAVEIIQTYPAAIYHELPRLVELRTFEPLQTTEKIAIVCAGTSDLPVAEEARLTAEFYGNTTERVYDAGVAGLHRLLASLETIRSCRVVVVIAGMEGALPSVVGGLIKAPIIAVPTSVGYGVAMGGMAALMGMLTSCASNVTTVNIDNGFGAAHVATLINRL